MWGMLANLARCLSAEAAHSIAVATLHHNLGPRPGALSTKANLGVTLAGLKFANPLGLAVLRMAGKPIPKFWLALIWCSFTAA